MMRLSRKRSQDAGAEAPDPQRPEDKTYPSRLLVAYETAMGKIR